LAVGKGQKIRHIGNLLGLREFPRKELIPRDMRRPRYEGMWSRAFKIRRMSPI
jgi:hypothetical protein